MSDTDLAFRTTVDGSGFATGMQQMTSQLNQFGIQTNAASANLGGLGTILGTMANPATAAALAITSVGAGLAASVNVAGDFQQKMAGVNAIVGGSAEDMKTLSDAAREAGASTSFSASQAADALGFMAGAGWNVQDSTAALKDTLMLASAGAMDLAQAGDLMTGTVSQFGLAATDSGRVANVLAAGASATNTSVSELGQGMKVVGATANAFGMSLESTTSALGLLSNGALKGSEGGTALRGILASLATQTGPAAAALAELGLTTADVNPETVSLSDSMTLLQERGMTATQAIAIFGRENVSAATYMAAHASELDGLQTSITGTSKASEMAAIQTATYQGAMGELSSAVEEAEIALGSVLLPVVTDTVKVFTGGVAAVTDFGKSLYDAYGEFQNWLAGVDSSFLKLMGIDPEVAKAAGAEAATNTATGITENKDLQTATGGTLGSDAAKAANKGAATDSAKEFSKEWVQAFEIAQNDREIAKILARGASLTQKETDDALRTFDYLGEQFALKITSHAGSAIGDWYSYSLKGGDTVLAHVGSASGYIDPLKAFTMATGLPAPAVGTEAYYRLLGDDIAAEKAKLQAQLKDSFDYSGIADPLKTRLENEGEIIGTQGSKTAQDAYSALLDNFREPAVEKLGGVLDEISTLAAERPLAASEYQLFGEEYKARLYASISDMKPYLEGQMKKLGEDTTNAFSDSFFSDSEKSSLLGMEPWLEYLKQKSPEEFAKAGGDSWLKFIEAIKTGASSAELEKMFGDMGQKAGKSFAEALGMNMNNALDSFDWASLTKKLTPVTAEGGQDFMKNAFQPELIENATKNLELWNTGLIQNRRQVEENIQSYIRMAEVNPWLFTPDQLHSIYEFTQGLKDESDVLDAIVKKTDNLKTATQKFANQTDEATACCGQLLSLFGAWQESTPSLFNPQYLGPSYGQDYEEQIIAKAASITLATENNDRYAQSIRGVYVAQSEANKALSDYMYYFYYEDEVPVDVRIDAMKALGWSVNEAQIRVDGLASAIANVNMELNSIDPVKFDKEILFPGDDTQTDITPTMGLDTTEALNDFLAFKYAIEAEKINVDLTAETGQEQGVQQASGSDSATLGRIASNVLAVNTSIRSLDTRSVSQLTQINSSIRSFDSRTASNLSHVMATMGNVGANITSTIGTAAGTISSAVYGAASMIVAALENSGGGGGGSGGNYSGGNSTVPKYRNYTVPEYASGGYADKPTLGIFGEAGPEYILPEQTLINMLSTSTVAQVRMDIDGSGLQSQLSAALNSIDIPALNIPARIDLEINYAEVKDMLDRAVKEVLAETRVR